MAMTMLIPVVLLVLLGVVIAIRFRKGGGGSGDASTPYDAAVIRRFADRLYRRSASIIGLYTLLGFVLGLGIAGFLQHRVAAPLLVGVALVPTVIAYAIASEKAFRLKLEAQVALCQAQIEDHLGGVRKLQTEILRRTAKPAAPSTGPAADGGTSE